MRCRSYPKTMKPSITTPNTPRPTGGTTACSLVRTTSRYPRVSSLRACGRWALAKKAANLSLIFGVFGMLILALAFWWVSHGFGIGMPIIIAAPLLSLLGLWQARVARQHGEDANVGLFLSGIGMVIVIAIVGFIIMIGFALYGFNDAGPSTSLSALSLR